MKYQHISYLSVILVILVLIFPPALRSMDITSSIDVSKTATPSNMADPGWDILHGFHVGNYSSVVNVTIDSLAEVIYGDLNGQSDYAVPQTSGSFIIIYKQTIPDGADDSFSFSISFNSSVVDTQSIKDDTYLMAYAFEYGSYIVQETVPAGWKVTKITCNQSGSGDINTATATIPIDRDGDFVCTFTNTQLGSITAYKFNDLNGDGVLNASEPGLSGWSMDLYNGSNCNDSAIASNITDGAGNVTFSGLPPYNYSVGETLQDGWQNTNELCQNITLAAGGSEIVYFGNQRIGACCYPDGSCVNDVQGPDCSATYSVWHNGKRCDEVNCAQPQACCFQDEPCQDVISQECFGLGGISAGPTFSCSDNPCTFGACCNQTPNAQPAAAVAQEDSNGFPCVLTVESKCIEGDWNPTCECEDGTCDPAPGACISEEGSCVEIARIDCFDEWVGGPCEKVVPTVTEWGLIVLSLLLAGSAAWFIRRKQKA